MKKKPAIYMAVVLPILGGGALLIVVGLMKLYSNVTAMPLSTIPQMNGFLITLPALFVWMPLALILSNAVLLIVPSLRKVADEYVSKSGHPGFFESQRVLGKLSLVFAAICIPLIVLGFLL